MLDDTLVIVSADRRWPRAWSYWRPAERSRDPMDRIWPRCPSRLSHRSNISTMDTAATALAVSWSVPAHPHLGPPSRRNFPVNPQKPDALRCEIARPFVCLALLFAFSVAVRRIALALWFAVFQ